MTLFCDLRYTLPMEISLLSLSVQLKIHVAEIEAMRKLTEKTAKNCLSMPTLIFIMFIALPCYGEIIFETDFNNNADWQPRPVSATNDTATAGAFVSCDYNTASCAAAPSPTGWDYYRSTGWWWGPNYEDTVRIKSTAGDGTVVGRGGAGKAFIMYNEANVGSSGDGWGADGILLKLLPIDQAELYVSFWLKTSALQFQNDRSNLKLFRTSHFDKTNTTIFQAFSGGPRAPIYVYDLQTSTTYGVEQMHSYRCDPQASDYYCPNSPAKAADSGTHFIIGDVLKRMPETPSDAGAWGDTNWHRHDFRIKMNTYAGSGTWNADGILEFWFDGVLQKSTKNIKWINSGTDTSIGWNTIEFGGNAYNNFSDNWVTNKNYVVGDKINYSGYMWECIQNVTYTNSTRPSFSTPIYWKKLGIVSGQKIEQWYAIDDVVVSTTPIPQDYVIGGTKPPTAPKNVTGTPIK